MVLLADKATFHAGYVAAVLEARGIAIVGPLLDAATALEAIAAPDICAAILAHAFAAEERRTLVAALDDRGVPHLTLAPTRLQPGDDGPMLTQPFAGYQVADWVIAHS